MPEYIKPPITTAIVRDYLKTIEGQEISLDQLRNVFNLERGTKSYAKIDPIISQLVEERQVRRLSRGWLKVVKQVQPVQVYGIEREDRPPFELIFPRDFDTMMEMDFAKDIIIREGDLISIGGIKSIGKSTLCMNYAGENVDKHPILMGNEYTIFTEEKYDIAPRFKGRFDTMSIKNGGWIDWVDKDGNDKFTLLPVWADYAEHIVGNRINIIDWVNLPGEYYMISPVMEGIKKSLGRGVGIIALQKNENSVSGRGGAMTRDFADLEILIDKFGHNEVLLTLGKVKEATKSVAGKTYVYSISEGVKIHNFREVKKCPDCRGTGYKASKPCEMCYTLKFVDA